MKSYKQDGVVKFKRSFWDWLAWIAYAYLMIYLFLKLFEFIHSLPFIDGIALASLAYYAGRYTHKIEVVELKLDEHIKDKNIHK